MSTPLVIGHRGACGYRPEHTLASYALAIEQGADYIEPDLVLSRDGVLVARHENEIGSTTDVADHVEFAARRRTQSIDGVVVTGWFTEDFTLAELRLLRARERLPQLRPQNTRFDGLFDIPTFNEILRFLAGVNATRLAQGLRPIGVYPETKHPTHFAALGLPHEAPLLAALKAGLAGAPVFIQSFELGNLQALRQQCDYPLVFLVDAAGAPWDLVRAGDARDYRALLQPRELARLAAVVSAVGVHKHLVIPWAANGQLAKPTALVADAHRAGLAVHAWTFRVENMFLPPALRSGTAAGARGEIEREIRAYLDAGLDGFFTDNADAGRSAVAGALR
jgi:glycerophosphoryl diester phosphodiesterase